MKDRREFLKTSSAFMGALAAFGLLGTANAADHVGTTIKRSGTTVESPDIKVLNAIFTDAIQTGSMPTTLTKFSNQITREQTVALGKITSQDLANMKIIRDKVATLDPGQFMGDAGGIFW
jgi:hypothetical protein